jgi:hypothetical protein
VPSCPGAARSWARFYELRRRDLSGQSLRIQTILVKTFFVLVWMDTRHETARLEPDCACRAQKLRFGADLSIPRFGWMAVRPGASKSH